MIYLALSISWCVAMSADGHADAGNVTQDDDTQAGDDYDDGLDDIAALHNNIAICWNVGLPILI